MNQWFLVTCKYTKQMEDGTLKRVSEPYLFDAISFSDAEEKAYKKIGENVKGEFLITAIKINSYADIYGNDEFDDWFKIKIKTVLLDEDSGREKKTSLDYLIASSSTENAVKDLKECLSDMTMSYEIHSVVHTKIQEVVPYDPELEDKELSRVKLEKEEE